MPITSNALTSSLNAGPNNFMDPNAPTSFKNWSNEPEFYDNAFNWEPKRQNEFYMALSGIPAYLIKTSDKPKIQNNEITLDHINVKRYVKGKSEWNTIGVTLYDPIVPSAAQMVMDWVRMHHESKTGRNGYSNYYKQNISLIQLSPLGEEVEEWKLEGAFIVDAEFGKYDWSAGDSVQEISLTLRYDYAMFEY
jgi:hypothetical protein